MTRIKVLSVRKEGTVNQEEALEQYLWLKKAQGLKSSTVDGIEENIRIFFRRYPEAWKEPKSSVFKFMAEKIKPATYNIRLAYLKPFFEWCVKEGIFAENPLIGFKRRRAEARVVNIDPEDLKRLINLPDKNTFAGLRDYALLLLTLDTGCRPSEALNLMIEDINFKALEVYIRCYVSKTKISRTLPISPIVVPPEYPLFEKMHFKPLEPCGFHFAFLKLSLKGVVIYLRDFKILKIDLKLGV